MELDSDDDKVQIKRFTNYVLMLEHEVMSDLKDDANVFKTKELTDFLRQENTTGLVKVVIVKTMANLQKKRAFKKTFLNSVFGVKNDE